VRVRALLERCHAEKMHGEVTLVFSDGAIVDVKKAQRWRAKDLPLPVAHRGRRAAGRRGCWH
jgi:hypothetical protein